jgi:cytochrome c-type biogenesis protein CcmH
MPLALLRRQVKDLPLDFTLDDSNAMMPQLSLSKFGRVVIGARISKSGDAAPHPGDLRGESGPVAVGASGISLEIAEVVP